MPGFQDNLILEQPLLVGLDLMSLQRLQDSFAAATGVASIIIDTNGRLVTRPSNFSEVCRLVQQTAKGREICDLSDHERSQRALASDAPVYHMCQSCGFLDGSAPIMIDGRRVAYWLVGQCNALGVSREDIALHAQTIGADVDAVLDAYDQMEPISVARFELVLEFLNLLIEQITTPIRVKS